MSDLNGTQPDRGDDDRADDERALNRQLDASVASQARRRRERGTLLDPELMRADMELIRQRASSRRATATPQPADDDVSIPLVLGGFERLALEALPPGITASGSTGVLDDFSLPPDPPLRIGTSPRARTLSLDPAKPASKSMPASELVDLRAAWARYWGDKPITPPVKDPKAWLESYRRQGTGEVSVASAVRAARTVTLERLRQVGMPIGAELGNGPLEQAITAICYIGPGFGAFFDTDGKLVTTPVGYSCAIAGVTAPAGDESGGIFFAGRESFTAISANSAGVQVSLSRVGRYGVLVEDRWQRRQELARWAGSDPNTGLLFAVNPNYWLRKGVGNAVADGPGRLWDAISRSVARGYLAQAIGEAIDELSLWGIAKEAFIAFVKRLAPIPLPGDIDDARRLGIAMGMAIWGQDKNAAGDIDASARILAPEIASEVMGKAAKGVGKAAGKLAQSAKGAVTTKSRTGGGKRPKPPGGPVDAPARRPAAVSKERVAPPVGDSVESSVRQPHGNKSTSGRAADNRSTARRSRSGRRAPALIASLTGSFGAQAANALLVHARQHLAAFRRADKREGAIQTVKGFVLEATVPKLGEISDRLSQARRLAPAMGVEPSSIRFTIDATDNRTRQDLSDGIIYGTRRRGASRPDHRRNEDAAGDEIVVFVIVESKAAGSVKAMAIEDGMWGQLERTRARVETAAITIDGVTYPAANLFVPADFGKPLRVIGVVPRGTDRLTRLKLEQQLRGEQGRHATITEAALSDRDAHSLAQMLLEELDETTP